MKSAHVILLLYHINTKLHDGNIKVMWQNDASVKVLISQQVIDALQWTPKNSVIKLSQSFLASLGTWVTKEGKLSWQMFVPVYNNFGLLFWLWAFFEEPEALQEKKIYD